MRNLIVTVKLLAAILFFVVSGYAQLPISIGVKGGVGLTYAFQDNTVSSIIPSGPALGTISIRNYSDVRDYIVGPFVELRLPFGFAVEGDALYRPMNLVTVTSLSAGGPSYTSDERYSAWEFSTLAKYRFRHVPLVKPFVFVGPSFRAKASSINYISTVGISAGGGAEFKLLFLRIAPEVRYTHWGSDSSSAFTSMNVPLRTSNQNQAELLLGISF